MARSSLRPCRKSTCRALARDRYCENHQGEIGKQRAEQDKKRGSSTQRGYGSKWQRARGWFLKSNPLCVRCEKDNRVTIAIIVDHIIPHKGNMRLFWDRLNWQPLCKRCHDIKTATEDGGFGRASGSKQEGEGG